MSYSHHFTVAVSDDEVRDDLAEHYLLWALADNNAKRFDEKARPPITLINPKYHMVEGAHCSHPACVDLVKQRELACRCKISPDLADAKVDSSECPIHTDPGNA